MSTTQKSRAGFLRSEALYALGRDDEAIDTVLKVVNTPDPAPTLLDPTPAKGGPYGEAARRLLGTLYLENSRAPEAVCALRAGREVDGWKPSLLGWPARRCRRRQRGCAFS